MKGKSSKLLAPDTIESLVVPSAMGLLNNISIISYCHGKSQRMVNLRTPSEDVWILHYHATIISKVGRCQMSRLLVAKFRSHIIRTLSR